MCYVTIASMREVYHPSKDEIRLSIVLHALSDPIRLQVVRELAQDGENNCSGFGIDSPKSTLSHHFKVLREAGIIWTRREGTQRFFSLRTEELDERFPGLLQAIVNATEPY